MIVFSHDVKLEGDSYFVKKYNYCSELYQKSNDENLTEEEQLKYWNMFMDERIKLEFGYE